MGSRVGRESKAMLAVGLGCEVNFGWSACRGLSVRVLLLSGFGNVFQGFERKMAIITFRLIKGLFGMVRV